jgi:hypothetical protein
VTDDHLGGVDPQEIVEEAEEIAAAAADPEAASPLADATPTGGDEYDLIGEDAPDDAATTFVAVEDASSDEIEPVGNESADPERDGVLVAEVAPLRPGDVPQTTIAVWSPDAVARFRQHLKEVQARFVDEPVEAVAEAQSLVTEAVRGLAEALLAEQLDLDPRQHSENPDTESLRVALRRYRDFLERILAL